MNITLNPTDQRSTSTTPEATNNTGTMPSTPEKQDQTAGLTETNNPTTATSSNADENPTPAQITTKSSKLNILRKKAEASREKTAIDAMRRLEMFDSTGASDWKTTGSQSLGAMKIENNATTVSGKNIGAEQKEPEWTKEQLKVIRKARSTVLSVQQVSNTKRAVMDPIMEFVGRGENDTAHRKGLHLVLGRHPVLHRYRNREVRRHRIPRYYAELVVADIDGNW